MRRATAYKRSMERAASRSKASPSPARARTTSSDPTRGVLEPSRRRTRRIGGSGPANAAGRSIITRAWRTARRSAAGHAEPFEVNDVDVIHLHEVEGQADV